MKRLVLLAALALAACNSAPALDASLMDNVASSYADAKTAAQLNGVSGEEIAKIDERANAHLADMRDAYGNANAGDYVRASLAVTGDTMDVLALVDRK